MENNAIIPIDDKIQLFADYLANNNRCILSARFGDGKTFFLQEFKKQYKEDYIFLTIYPVNYQVAENKDVFEYIKRDLLIQLLMSKEVELSDDKYSFLQCLEGFVCENIDKLLNDAIFTAAHILSGVSKPMIDTLKKNVSKFKEYTKEVNASQSDVVEKYIETFSEQRSGIYEFDPISRLIFQLLSDVKQETNKQVVLVVEDLDRIDPAHIFRIMNIFSAHWDNYDYSETKLRWGDVANKYNFDKVLIVCHFQNIKTIFHHFYGAGTDFTGYIHKYSPTYPFEYSLKESVKEWIMNHLPEDIQSFEIIGKVLTNLIVEKYFEPTKISTNLRHITSYLLKPCYKTKKGTMLFNGQNYELDLNNRITRLLCIFREFGISIEDFFRWITYSANNRYKTELSRFVGPCWLLYQLVSKQSNVIYFHGCTQGKITYSSEHRFYETSCECNPSRNSEKYIIKEINVCNQIIYFENIDAMKMIFTKCEEYIY